jgi:hypothetical protein
MEDCEIFRGRKFAGGLKGRARGGGHTGLKPCALCGRPFSPEGAPMATLSFGHFEPLVIHAALHLITPPLGKRASH